MVTSNGLDSAKQGNLDAIAALMNKSLQSKGITVTATASGECLTIIAEAKTVPDKTALVDCIRKGITALNPKAVDRVVIQGKALGQTHTNWREGFSLSSSSTNGMAAASGNGAISSKPIAVVSNTKSEKRWSSLLERLLSVRDLANTALLAAIFLILAIGLLTGNRPHQVVWEYKVEGVEDELFDYTMQQMGADGWELTSARRAVSGSGDDSYGLYEVIFRRQTTKAQAQRNIKKAEEDLKAQQLATRQSLAKMYIGSINRAQQAHRIIDDAFAPTLAELDVGIDSDTENYTFAISLQGSYQAIATATPKSSGMKSYTGAVALINGMTRSILCETDSPSKTPPASPVANGNELQCATGSSEPN